MESHSNAPAPSDLVVCPRFHVRFLQTSLPRGPRKFQTRHGAVTGQKVQELVFCRLWGGICHRINFPMCIYTAYMHIHIIASILDSAHKCVHVRMLENICVTLPLPHTWSAYTEIDPEQLRQPTSGHQSMPTPPSCLQSYLWPPISGPGAFADVHCQPLRRGTGTWLV